MEGHDRHQQRQLKKKNHKWLLFLASEVDI